jgi:hypothetical protein
MPPRRAAEPRLKASNPVEVAVTTDMLGADEVGGKVVRVGVRFSVTGVFEVWCYGSTGYGAEALLAVNHRTECAGCFAGGRGYRGEACWQDLGGVDARTSEECHVRFARVCGTGCG